MLFYIWEMVWIFDGLLIIYYDVMNHQKLSSLK